MGAQLVREVANNTSDLTGDGTTTATLLAQAIVREGMQALDEGANPMLLRRGIEEATERAGRRAAARRPAGRGPRRSCATSPRSRPRRTRSSATRWPRRSTASAREGVVTIEEADVPGIAVDFVEGMVVENGWVSPYMVRDTERMETVFEDPLHPHDQQADLAPAATSCRRSTS